MQFMSQLWSTDKKKKKPSGDSSPAARKPVSPGDLALAGVLAALAGASGAMLALSLRSAARRQPRPCLPVSWRFVAGDEYLGEALASMLPFAHGDPEAYLELGEACDAMVSLWLALNDPGVAHRHAWMVYAYRYERYAFRKLKQLCEGVKRAIAERDARHESSTSQPPDGGRNPRRDGAARAESGSLATATPAAPPPPRQPPAPLPDHVVRRHRLAMQTLCRALPTAAERADTRDDGPAIDDLGTDRTRSRWRDLPRFYDIKQFYALARNVDGAMKAYYQSIVSALTLRPMNSFVRPARHRDAVGDDDDDYNEHDANTGGRGPLPTPSWRRMS